MTRKIILMLVFLLSSQAAVAERIASADERLVYSGRIAVSEAAARFDWPGVAIRFRATEGEIEALLAGNGSDFNVYIDDQLVEVWRGASGIDKHTLLVPAGAHDVRIVRRNDGNYGTAVFSGLRLSKGAKLLDASRLPQRRIEFIGDSTTVGYGVEGPGSQCTNIRRYENASLAYAALTARALAAEAHIVAMSSKGLLRNYGDKAPVSEKPMPAYWRQTLARSELADWDFSTWQPHAVVIKLGTNDYSTRPFPPADEFVAALSQLIADVRNAYQPDTPIFLMAYAVRPQVLQAYTQVADAHHDAGVELVLVEGPENASETGCQGHPGRVPQQRMAEALTHHMRESLGWR